MSKNKPQTKDRCVPDQVLDDVESTENGDRVLQLATEAIELLDAERDPEGKNQFQNRIISQNLRDVFSGITLWPWMTMNTVMHEKGIWLASKR